MSWWRSQGVKRQCFAGVISWDLITAVASGRVDLGECKQVELDDGLEGLRSGAVAQADAGVGRRLGVARRRLAPASSILIDAQSILFVATHI